MFCIFVVHLSSSVGVILSNFENNSSPTLFCTSSPLKNFKFWKFYYYSPNFRSWLSAYDKIYFTYSLKFHARSMKFYTHFFLQISNKNSLQIENSIQQRERNLVLETTIDRSLITVLNIYCIFLTGYVYWVMFSFELWSLFKDTGPQKYIWSY